MDWKLDGCHLPSEIWDLILSYLPLVSIRRASLANKESAKCLHYVYSISLTQWELSEAWSKFETIVRLLPHLKSLAVHIRIQSHALAMQNVTKLGNLQELLIYGGIYLQVGERPLIYDITEKLPQLQRLLLEFYPKNINYIALHSPNLTSLQITAARRDKLFHLNSLATLTRLKELKIVAYGNAAPKKFEEFSKLTALTKLDLTGAVFSDAIEFSDLTLLTNLAVLKLSQVKYDSMNRVMNKLMNLRRLEFLQHISGASSETMLDECDGLTRLTHMYLDDLYGKEEKILRLTQLRSFAALGMFNGIEKMSQLKKLKVISSIPAEPFTTLCSVMTGLERLYLWSWLNTNIGDEEFKYITKLSNLKSLYIYGMDALTNEGLRCVTALSRLRRLDVAGEDVSIEGSPEIRAMTALRYLRINAPVTQTNV